MLFNSFEFLVFLPIVFLLYWFVFKPLKWQNLLVVSASYVFYGWWDWRFLFLIALTTICSFASGLLIEHYDNDRKTQKAISAINIILNISILGIFKYYNFFAENFQLLFSSFGISVDWPTLHIILPVGISFYTFQALSYSIDVYRRKIKATKDVVAFFAFISFFPQLVAGPIERATNLLPQFLKPRSFNEAKAVDGLRQILWGFFKKVVVADTCASTLMYIWEDYHHMSGISLFFGGLLFTFQIYGDFSGYSDIAIGTARLFGVNLKRNFAFPYFSRSIPEFWRRWHISLMTWFRDYIYFPLGGSRCSQWKAIRNVFIVWGVSGLWHGANWTFICWGLFHGILLAVYNLLGINTKYEHEVAHGRFLPSVKEMCQMLFTFFLAVIGWIIFRAETMTQAVSYLYRMFTKPFEGMSAGSLKYTFFFVAIMLLAEWVQRDKQHALEFVKSEGILKYRVVRWSIYMSVLMVTLVFAGEQSQFIYFQF
jgi:D-alanyl-lipoteichoic acid acyltransferase DltB (MBOAT superfamily)